jgi:hypothetical protein
MSTSHGIEHSGIVEALLSDAEHGADGPVREIAVGGRLVAVRQRTGPWPWPP